MDVSSPSQLKWLVKRNQTKYHNNNQTRQKWKTKSLYKVTRAISILRYAWSKVICFIVLEAYLICAVSTSVCVCALKEMRKGEDIERVERIFWSAISNTVISFWLYLLLITVVVPVLADRQLKFYIIFHFFRVFIALFHFVFLLLLFLNARHNSMFNFHFNRCNSKAILGFRSQSHRSFFHLHLNLSYYVAADCVSAR